MLHKKINSKISTSIFYPRQKGKTKRYNRIGKDESNFVFDFDALNNAANDIVLLATDKTSADAFYGVSFIVLPQGISNALGKVCLKAKGFTLKNIETELAKRKLKNLFCIP